MSISSIITRGYGTWGSVNLLPTWGYEIGVVSIATDLYTTRLTLTGASAKRLPITATAATRLAITSTSATRLPLDGSSK